MVGRRDHRQRVPVEPGEQFVDLPHFPARLRRRPVEEERIRLVEQQHPAPPPCLGKGIGDVRLGLADPFGQQVRRALHHQRPIEPPRQVPGERRLARARRPGEQQRDIGRARRRDALDHFRHRRIAFVERHVERARPRLRQLAAPERLHQRLGRAHAAIRLARQPPGPGRHPQHRRRLGCGVEQPDEAVARRHALVRRHPRQHPLPGAARRQAEPQHMAHPPQDRAVDIADRVGRPDHRHPVGLQHPVDEHLAARALLEPVAVARAGLADQVLHLVEQQRRAPPPAEHPLRQLHRRDAFPALGLGTVLVRFRHRVQPRARGRRQRPRELGLAGARRPVDQQVDAHRPFDDRAAEQPDEIVRLLHREIVEPEPRDLAGAGQRLEQRPAGPGRRVEHPLERPAQVDLVPALIVMAEARQPEPHRRRAPGQPPGIDRLCPDQCAEQPGQVDIRPAHRLDQPIDARHPFGRDHQLEQRMVERTEAEQQRQLVGDLEHLRAHLAQRPPAQRRRQQRVPADILARCRRAGEPVDMRQRPFVHRLGERRGGRQIPADPAEHPPDDLMFVHKFPCSPRAQARVFATRGSAGAVL